jgi:hypothetical protein
MSALRGANRSGGTREQYRSPRQILRFSPPWLTVAGPRRSRAPSCSGVVPYGRGTAGGRLTPGCRHLRDPERCRGTRTPGVVMRESLVLYRDDPQPRPPLPEWADSVGDVRPARHDELPPGFPRGLRFTVPLVEMPRYLPFLYDVVIRAGGTHVNRRITGLDDVLSPDVIVNAAGLAAGALVGDATVFPIRGQIVRVAIPASTCRSATKCIREAGRRFTRARQIASSAARLRSAAGTRSPTPPRLPRASNGAPTSSPRSSAQAYSKPSWDCGQDARRSGWRWTATYCRYL